jgi:hypothetical protein
LYELNNQNGLQIYSLDLDIDDFKQLNKIKLANLIQFDFTSKTWNCMIKNFINSGSNKNFETIENYWILKEKLNLTNKSWTQFEDFDLIDQSISNYDSSKSLKVIFASNIKINLGNMFILSDLTSFNAEIIDLNVSNKIDNFYSVNLECKINHAGYTGTGYLFLIDTNINFMRLIDTFNITDSYFSFKKNFNFHDKALSKIDCNLEINEINKDYDLKECFVLFILNLVNKYKNNTLVTFQLPIIQNKNC